MAVRAEFRGDDALADLARLMEGSPVGMTLDEPALALSAVLQPRLDRLEWLARLDELAAACPTPTRDGVARYVIGDLGFAGDTRSYTSWMNSCLDRVVATRRGIPISLAIVTIEIARRVGVSLVGVGMPGHFLVGDPADPEWFTDPFRGHLALTRDECRQIFDELSAGRTPWSEHHLSQSPNRLVIARMLNNLKAWSIQNNDRVKLALVMKMRAILPEFGDESVEATVALSALN